MHSLGLFKRVYMLQFATVGQQLALAGEGRPSVGKTETSRAAGYESSYYLSHEGV